MPDPLRPIAHEILIATYAVLMAILALCLRPFGRCLGRMFYSDAGFRWFYALYPKYMPNWRRKHRGTKADPLEWCDLAPLLKYMNKAATAPVVANPA